MSNIYLHLCYETLPVKCIKFIKTWALSRKKIFVKVYKGRGLQKINLPKYTNPKFHIVIVRVFYIHLGYSLNYIVLIQLSPLRRGIPLPGGGIEGKNWGTWSKTTVWSKGVFPLWSGGGPFTVSNSDIRSKAYVILYLVFIKTGVK